MVLEHAVLPVRPGEEEAFERAFARARPLVAATPGFLWLRLERCLERPGTYLLLIGWRSVEDHTQGFRGSSRYEEWRRLLHGFYDPFPVVEHFTTVSAVDAALGAADERLGGGEDGPGAPGGCAAGVSVP